PMLLSTQTLAEWAGFQNVGRFLEPNGETPAAWACAAGRGHLGSVPPCLRGGVDRATLVERLKPDAYIASCAPSGRPVRGYALTHAFPKSPRHVRNVPLCTPPPTASASLR